MKSYKIKWNTRGNLCMELLCKNELANGWRQRFV